MRVSPRDIHMGMSMTQTHVAPPLGMPPDSQVVVGAPTRSVNQGMRI